MLKILLVVICNLVFLGLICPELVSSDDTVLCSLGMVIVCSMIYLDLNFIIKEIKSYENKN